MIQIDFEEPEDEQWTDWRTRCKEATKELINDFNAGRPIRITDLHKEKKRVFFKHDDYFYGKCVYCESLISSNQPGDVEHFRPKGKVTDIEHKQVVIDVGGEEIAHPGYYWLAYEITNLMPACVDCNRISSGNSEGKKIGKWMRFPVKGRYAINPGEEVDEEPLLINPVQEDTSVHLEIDNMGIMLPVGGSLRGNTCIDVFGLNDRASLVNERKVMYKQVRNEVKLARIAIVMGAPNKEELMGTIQDYRDGKRPYTIAARKAIEDEKAEYENEMAAL